MATKPSARRSRCSDHEQTPDGPKQQTANGYEVPVRSRETVLADFRKVVAPPKDRDRPKPSK